MDSMNILRLAILSARAARLRADRSKKAAEALPNTPPDTGDSAPSQTVAPEAKFLMTKGNRPMPDESAFVGLTTKAAMPGPLTLLSALASAGRRGARNLFRWPSTAGEAARQGVWREAEKGMLNRVSDSNDVLFRALGGAYRDDINPLTGGITGVARTPEYSEGMQKLHRHLSDASTAAHDYVGTLADQASNSAWHRQLRNQLLAGTTAASGVGLGGRELYNRVLSPRPTGTQQP